MPNGANGLKRQKGSGRRKDHPKLVEPKAEAQGTGGRPQHWTSVFISKALHMATIGMGLLVDNSNDDDDHNNNNSHNNNNNNGNNCDDDNILLSFNFL